MSEISLIPAINISASGLDAENKRMEVIANNVANANTTKGENGQVFRRKQVIFASKLADAMAQEQGRAFNGVEVKGIVEDQRDPKRVHRPGHPDADEEGYISLPNISQIEEMVDMMSASRAYEANLAAIRMAKEMANDALNISK